MQQRVAGGLPLVQQSSLLYVSAILLSSANVSSLLPEWCGSMRWMRRSWMWTSVSSKPLSPEKSVNGMSFAHSWFSSPSFRTRAKSAASGRSPQLENKEKQREREQKSECQHLTGSSNNTIQHRTVNRRAAPPLVVVADRVNWICFFSTKCWNGTLERRTRGVVFLPWKTLDRRREGGRGGEQSEGVTHMHGS